MIWNNLTLPDKPYYQDDAVLIYNADCREILPLIPDKSIDLVLTSPPYADLREYGGYSWEFETTVRLLAAVLNLGAIIVWIVGDTVNDGSESGEPFRQALYFKSIGLNLHDTMIYGKNGAASPDAIRYTSAFEYMFVFSNGKPKTFNPLTQESLYYTGKLKYHTRRQRDGQTIGGMYMINPTRVLDNIWIYDIGYMKSAKQDYIFEHPAIFPEALAFDHIVSWSNPNDFILDPFLGSGTTAYCAKKLGRKCIGIEIEEKYCEIAAKRCSQTVMNLEVETPKETASTLPMDLENKSPENPVDILTNHS